MIRNKEEFNIIVKICERAERMNIEAKDRLTLLLDIENTHKHMGLRLQDLLEADDANFAHDIVGIQNHINRETKKLDMYFVPRYAAQKEIDIDSIINKAKASSDNGQIIADKSEKEVSD